MAHPGVLATEEVLLQKQQPLEEASLSLFPLREDSVDLAKVQRYRQRSTAVAEEKKGDDGQDDETKWSRKNAIGEQTTAAEANKRSFAPTITDLPVEAQEMLKAASFLGSLDARLLQAATSSTEETVAEYLALAADKGVLISSSDGYLFSDNEREDAHNLVPANKKSRFHVAIGRNLVRNLTQQELEDNVHTVLDQFHSGEPAITKQQERNAIAVLCLQGGRKAVAASDFHTASSYLDFGIDLLERNHWKNEYDLSLALYNAFGEVLYCTADYDKMDSVVAAVLENGRCFRDTLRSRSTRVYSLGARYRMKEAVDEGLYVLRHLGEKRFPSKPRQYHVTFEFARTKRMLKGQTNEMVLRMPLMSDPDKIAVMQIINVMLTNSFHVSPKLGVLLVFRLVQLTMQHGTCGVSSVGFSLYGLLCCTVAKKKGKEYRYCELALALLEKFQAKEWLPRVYSIAYGEAGTYRHNLRELYAPLKESHRVGLETGDMEFALLSANMLVSYVLFSGEPLARVKKETLYYYSVSESQKQEVSLRFLKPTLYLVRQLTGDIDLASTIIYGEAESNEKSSFESEDLFTKTIVHFIHLLLSCLFNDLETAEREAEKIENVLLVPYIHPGFSSMLTFYSLALLLVAAKRRGRTRRKLLRKATRTLRILEQFVLCNPDVCIGQTCLLQAQLAAVTGNYKVARGKYVLAISVAGQSDNLMILAVACERMAEFLRDRKDETAAAHYFREAHSAYTSWGATAKVENLEKQMPHLFS